MTKIAEEAIVSKSVRVSAPIERAFSVFVEQMETWWPATHHIGKTPFEAIFVEPRVGGRWYERDVEGKHADWGTVLAWDPPHLVTFSWHVGPGHDSPDWVCDPDMAKASEVQIRFTAEAPGITLVELEHSKLERHSDGYEQLRAVFDGPVMEELLILAENGVHEHVHFGPHLVAALGQYLIAARSHVREIREIWRGGVVGAQRRSEGQREDREKDRQLFHARTIAQTGGEFQ